MKLVSRQIGLLLVVVSVALFMAACDSALLSDSTDENNPIQGANGTPFLEFQSGNLSDTSSVARSSDPEGLLVGPNVQMGDIGDETTYEYELVAGPNATAGEDFADATPNPPRIPVDTSQSTTGANTDTIEVQIGAGSLTRSSRLVTVNLTSVSTTSDENIQLGRNGTEFGRSRTLEIGPSIFVRAAAPAIDPGSNLFSVGFDTTTVGQSSSPSPVPVLENGSAEATTADNFRITGPDAGAFTFAGGGAAPIGGIFVAPGPSATLGARGGRGVINIFFAPSSSGEKTATLEFDMENNTDDTTVELDLAGVAVSN